MASQDKARVHLDKEYVLDPRQHKFPLTLALESGPITGSRAWIAVVLYRGETEVGAADAVVPIASGQVTNVTLRVVVP